MWVVVYLPLPPLNKGIIGNHYPTWPENLEDWEVRGELSEFQPWHEKLCKAVAATPSKKNVFFGLSSWFETHAKPIRKPIWMLTGSTWCHESKWQTWKVCGLRKTGFDSMWMLEINQECNMWAEDIRGVLGWFYDIYWYLLIFIDIYWYLWCTLGLIEWSFAVTGGAEYCRVPVSIQWNDMWRKHEDTLEHDLLDLSRP